MGSGMLIEGGPTTSSMNRIVAPLMLVYACLMQLARAAPQYGGKSRGPKPTKNLLEMISKESELSKFGEALYSSGLDTKLSGSDFFTVFAPNDNAIQNEDLTEETVEAFVSHHLVKGFPRRRIDLSSGETSLATVAGDSIVVVKTGNKISVGDAAVVTPDIIATNGVLHIVNKIL